MTTESDGLDFDGYIEAHGAGLERYAYVLTGDVHAAEDLVQTSLIKAYRRWRRIGRTDFPDAYVRRIVTTTFLDDRRRREAIDLSVAEVPDRPGGPDPADRAVHRDEVVRALAVLTPKQRAVIVLRHYLGRSDEDIAAELHCSDATVRSHASRALLRMREYLSYPELKEKSW